MTIFGSSEDEDSSSWLAPDLKASFWKSLVVEVPLASAGDENEAHCHKKKSIVRHLILYIVLDRFICNPIVYSIRKMSLLLDDRHR